MTKSTYLFLATALLLLIGFSLSADARGSGNEREATVAKIQQTFDAEEYEIYGDDFGEVGYPLCRDVMDRRLRENEQIIEMVGDSLVVARFQEMDRTLPSQEYRDAQQQYEDYPEYPVTHWRNVKSDPGACFAEDTPIVRLDPAFGAAENGRYGKNETTIYSINLGDFVLASTAGMFPNDPRYQIDCWAEVMGLYQGKVPHGMVTTLIEYKTDGGLTFTIEATTGHRIYVYNFQKQGWDWIKANHIEKGAVLFSDCKGGRCRVTQIEPKKAHYYDNGWEEFWWNVGGEYDYVFNFASEAYAFYVGPENKRILVHNFW